MAHTTLESLASTIYANATELSNIAKENGINPSLDDPVKSDLSSVAPLAIRNELIQAAKDLIHLAMGPADHVLSLAWSGTDAANLDLLTRFEVPQHVPINSTISFPELSKVTGLPEDVLTRGVRYGIANGLFREATPGNIAHSAASAALSNNLHLRNIVHFGTEFLQNILMKIPETMIMQTDETTDKVPETAFNLAYRTDENLFQYFAHSTELNRKYHEYLMGRVNTPLWSTDKLGAAWDWASLGSKTIIDVGGSSGHTVLAIAPLAPNAQFIIQDNNTDALDMGRKLVLRSPDLNMRSRITFEQHNFFEEQPVIADGYIFRHILHDWNDSDSVAILKALVPALRPGAKVYISEGLLPDPPAKRINALTNKMILIEDQFMLAAHDAKERTLGDFVRLFEQASPRFLLKGVTSGADAGSFNSLLEFEFQ
ncbi:uncharacterized protein N7483_011813 [Penicillium malachiteum]|uniref:uncharacterized protein n=1 Tax=Penicillium malachiteum TaxID=1324776 RepID=UPI002547B6EC|nr:uncharacterized protein N7483_011813 [Penicillium malachiteum]KAJ5714632.1 hypothetical protein N7483_011813 [Penicillium malachiteum]